MGGVAHRNRRAGIDAASVRRGQDALRELEGLDPHAIRERVIAVMQDVGDGEGATFWSLGKTERGLQPVRVHATEFAYADRYRDSLHALDYSLPVLDPRRPKRETANRFVGGVRSGWVDQLRRTPIYDIVWRPIGLHDQLRAFLYHGDRFVGTLSAGRLLGSSPFEPSDAARARLLMPAMLAALLVAEAAEVQGGAADLVVCPNGSIELASPSAQAWLTMPGFRERVREVVRALERGQDQPLEALALASVKWSRLHGAGGHRYLLHLTPLTPVRVAPDGVLSATQRRAAEYLAAGATIAETARAMGIRPETVRTHLREVYARLGIGSRAELANVLSLRFDPKEPRGRGEGTPGYLRK